MISSVIEIIKLTKAEDLTKEMEVFVAAADKRIEPIEKLLAKDIRSAEEITVTSHMTAVDAYRQVAVRIFALAACFLEHAKSPYFALVNGTEFQRNSKQKQMIAPFTGMYERYNGLVKSIDSRVNLCKVLLRESGDNTANTRIN